MAIPASLREELSNRQFALLWGGQTVSQFGDGVISVTLPLLVLTMTRSGADVGYVVAARLVPTVLLLLLGGVITDRTSRRLAMLLSDVSRSVIIAILGILGVLSQLTFSEVVVGAVLFGVFDALFYPASTAMLPEVIAPERLTSANSLSRLSGAISGSLVGPVAGGLIASTLGTSWSLILDAGTFVVSGYCLFRMKPTSRPTRSDGSVLSEVKAGLVFCRTRPWILWSILVAGLANAFIFAPSAVLLPLLFKRALHASNWMVGFGFGATGLGGLVGSVIMLTLSPPRRRVLVMWVAWSGGALCVVPFGLAPSPWLAILAAFFVGASLMIGNILWASLMQSEVPRAMLGRVSSVDWMVSLGLSPLGVALAGVVAGIIGIRTTIVVPGAVIGLLAILTIGLVRSITGPDRK